MPTSGPPSLPTCYTPGCTQEAGGEAGRYKMGEKECSPRARLTSLWPLHRAHWAGNSGLSRRLGSVSDFKNKLRFLTFLGKSSGLATLSCILLRNTLGCKWATAAPLKGPRHPPAGTAPTYPLPHPLRFSSEPEPLTPVVCRSSEFVTSSLKDASELTQIKFPPKTRVPGICGILLFIVNRHGACFSSKDEELTGMREESVQAGSPKFSGILLMCRVQRVTHNILGSGLLIV